MSIEHYYFGVLILNGGRSCMESFGQVPQWLNTQWYPLKRMIILYWEHTTITKKKFLTIYKEQQVNHTYEQNLHRFKHNKD